MTAARQLLIYEFGVDSTFEGRLVGALERIQAADGSRVLDGLFVTNERDTGELAAIDLRSGSATGTVARLLTFRLEPQARRRATERALGDLGSVPADVIQKLGSALDPGSAILALLVERPDWRELGDAVARTGGWMVSVESVSGSSLAELGPSLLAAFR